MEIISYHGNTRTKENSLLRQCLVEMQEDSQKHNKLFYWIRYATIDDMFRPFLWGHLQV